jgi:hypothetical protein
VVGRWSLGRPRNRLHSGNPRFEALANQKFHVETVPAAGFADCAWRFALSRALASALPRRGVEFQHENHLARLLPGTASASTVRRDVVDREAERLRAGAIEPFGSAAIERGAVGELTRLTVGDAPVQVEREAAVLGMAQAVPRRSEFALA